MVERAREALFDAAGEMGREDAHHLPEQLAEAFSGTRERQGARAETPLGDRLRRTVSQFVDGERGRVVLPALLVFERDAHDVPKERLLRRPDDVAGGI